MKGGELSRIELAIVLAAGDGKRMRSKLPKVLHEVAGLPILGHVLAAVTQVEPSELRVVIGAGSDLVAAQLNQIAPAATQILQAVRGGTGHAARLALTDSPTSGSVLICAGDTPLLRGETLRDLATAHHESGASVTVLTTEMGEPDGYGRIVRTSTGEFEAIVEERDADAAVREIAEINSGVYIFDIAALRSALPRLTKSNAQQEEYLTDVIAILRGDGAKVATHSAPDFTEVLGVNDRSQLSVAAFMMQGRINEALMSSGVTIVDSMSTWIDITAQIDVDVRIEPGSIIKGKSRIASGAVIGPRTTLIDCDLDSEAVVIESYCVASSIGKGANVGPYTHLRGGTVLAAQSRAGSFVEIKNSVVGEGSKVPHLSYVGDAKIGRGSNIGAATVFVNYDGVAKHETTIGDEVRIGSDSMLVAPVTIGDGAYTAAGSVITEDVPPGALGIGRARQVNILGWVRKRRPGSKSDQAAANQEASE